MANFDRSGMTQAGINLMGKAVGGATIQFTKLVLGDGTMTGEILDLQGVVSPKQNVDVTRIERNDNQCTVGGELLTSSVKQGFFWRECGLYAMDPDQGEILYNYAYSTKPDYIAQSDSGIMEEILVSMITFVGANANVDITIDDSMVFATKKEFKNTTGILSQQVDNLNNNKMNKNTTDISVTQLNKNRGKLDESYMTDEFLQQIAGNTPISAVPANKSITFNKLAFYPVVGSINKNLFDKSNVTHKTYLLDNGETMLAEDYSTSDFINLEPDSAYYLTMSGRYLLFNSDKTPIGKCVDNNGPITTPIDCCYIKVSIVTSTLDTTQIEKGSVQTPYEPYGFHITDESFKFNTINGKMLKDKTLDIKKMIQMIAGKNLFNKKTIINGKYVAYDNGLLVPNENYFTSDFIEVQPNTIYCRNVIDQMACYDENKKYIRGYSYSDPKYFTTPTNCKYIRVCAPLTQLSKYQVELGDIPTEYEPYGFELDGLKLPNIPKTIPNVLYTLNQAWVSWQNNEKFPIGFLGDSTTDGASTTGWIGHEVIDNENGGIGKIDYVHEKAYPYILEQLIKKETGSTNPRIYNIGYSGTNLTWLIPKLDRIFGSVYSDVKMVGLVHGINDRVDKPNMTEVEYEKTFRENLICVIEFLYNKGIQPFMVTTQATLECGVGTNFQSYPLRTSEAINSIANKVKKELAKEYGLEIIDMNSFGENILTNSQYSLKSICNDRLHFGDLGHSLEAQYLFSQVCPRTIQIKDSIQNKIGFTSQKIVSKVPYEKLTLLDNYNNGFKITANYDKVDTKDLLVQDFWIMNNSKKKISIYSVAESHNNNSYIKINDVVTQITSPKQLIGTFDIGLLHVQAYTGNTVNVNFLGFIVE